MRSFVNIECVVMNALIVISKIQQKQELTFDDIVRYGKRAGHVYRRSTGDSIALLLSEAHQASMMESYPQYLDVDAYIDRGVFRLKDGVSIAEMEDTFRWTLDADLLHSFWSYDAISALAG